MITVEIRLRVNDDEDDAHCLAGARCHHVCYGYLSRHPDIRKRQSAVMHYRTTSQTKTTHAKDHPSECFNLFVGGTFAFLALFD